jgi:hypothetical protein
MRLSDKIAGPDFDLSEELMIIKAPLLAAVKDWNTYRKLMMKK